MPALAPNPTIDQRKGGVAQCPTGEQPPGRKGVAVGSAGQEQEPEEERGAAQLADPEGDPTGSGLGRVAAMDPDEDVEGDGECLPGEEEREGVARRRR